MVSKKRRRKQTPIVLTCFQLLYLTIFMHLMYLLSCTSWMKNVRILLFRKLIGVSKSQEELNLAASLCLCHIWEFFFGIKIQEILQTETPFLHAEWTKRQDDYIVTECTFEFVFWTNEHELCAFLLIKREKQTRGYGRLLKKTKKWKNSGKKIV